MPSVNTVSHAKPLAVTSGEPAGIGPDICLSAYQSLTDNKVVVIGDQQLLAERANKLGVTVPFASWQPGRPLSADALNVFHTPLQKPVVAGQLNQHNAPYVLETLNRAADGCLAGDFAGMVTAPVQKSVINQSGLAFSGHTEYLAERVGGHPVMMLSAEGSLASAPYTLRVALVTTHLPLRDVADAVTEATLSKVITVLDHDLRTRFSIANPKIVVCGLNPHAGEDGHLGKEEIEVITPCLDQHRRNGINLVGPLPADTLFLPRHLDGADAVLAMYHDQGLPVLKHYGFGSGTNITLGLPIIRTSVDHGTALDLAGSGKADASSLLAAIHTATQMRIA